MALAEMSVSEQANTLLSLATRQLDRVVSPSTRAATWDRTLDLAARRPGAFTFTLLLALLSAPPLLLFLTFVTTTLLLSLGAALLVTLFWTGVALFFLVPALLLATGTALFLFAWGMGTFLAARWVGGRMGWDLGGLVGDRGDRTMDRTRDGGREGVEVKTERKTLDGQGYGGNGVNVKDGGYKTKKTLDDGVVAYKNGLDRELEKEFGVKSEH